MDSTHVGYFCRKQEWAGSLKSPWFISAKTQLIQGLLDRFNPAKKVASSKIIARKSVARQLAVAA
tara:strand:+ start:17453 stop:17647 length:195 start_codon:yes stop_codon:yes gene_type:complete